LQQEVKEAVENMTGLQVVEVNVRVEGVELQNQKSENDQEPRVR
jgi:uncharacterized alkaline shock family protein YloU